MAYDEEGNVRKTVGDLLDHIEEFFGDVVPQPYDRLTEDKDDNLRLEAAACDEPGNRAYAIVLIAHTSKCDES
jgi:hypothetical protein